MEKENERERERLRGGVKIMFYSSPSPNRVSFGVPLPPFRCTVSLFDRRFPLRPVPVTPDPVKPTPVILDLVKPVPVTPESDRPVPATPEPGKPDPVLLDPVKPVPVTPESVRPIPVIPEQKYILYTSTEALPMLAASPVMATEGDAEVFVLPVPAMEPNSQPPAFPFTSTAAIPTSQV
ncbi:hypothetical protein G5714_023330 [Onychostoma macrolepis]|uniref:Uncharacterized protein n=1 Tax=Onychostoma macrolepis TaxID=369639 RepID=A0A7J6BKU0_9TELE|nr:hypothetical protein G5714_023330 [Onychostoma macrolepis]